jgi:CO/xanthine dehydrogenase Mo-binding subunit
MQTRQLTRRQMLQGSGGVVITFSLAAAFRQAGLANQAATPTIAPELGTPVATPAVEPGLVATPAAQTEQDVQTRNVSGDTVDSWLEIDADGNVTIYAGKVELGTGITTALAQIVAEELDVAFDRTTMIVGDTFLSPDQRYTAGSKSIQVAGPVLQQAAAEARLVLLTRASEQLGVPADQLQVEDGIVSATGDGGTSVSYGELAGEPFLQEVTGDAPTKPPADHTVVGQSVQRVDILAKLTGGEAFVQDVRLEGMLHGRVIRPYVRTMDGVGATVENVDDSAVQGMPGLVAVVQNGNFVGVVAEREEQAITASQALKVTWSEPAQLPDQDAYYELIRELEAEDVEVLRNGDVDGALGIASQTIEATYHFPHQAHASMGPSCSVADVRADGATIYSPTQGVYPLRDAIAPLLGFEPEQIRVIHREGAGCYGHNGADDVSADAAVLSQAVGRPVRVQWMRQDEFAWEPKGPAMVTDLRAGLDEDGNILAWDYEVWTPTHSTRPGGMPGNLLAGQMVDPPAETAENGNVGGDRNAPTNYSFPNNRVTAHWIDAPPLRPSALRSLGGLPNATHNEAFLDEVAALAGADPVEFRVRHLADPRAIAVIEEAAKLAGWEPRAAGSVQATPAADGLLSGRGIAFARYETEFAYAAAVAEVAVDPASGEVKVTRVVVAHDCGLIINPDGLRNQIQGNVIQGVSRALKERITFDQTSVTSLDWSSYHILTFAEVPEIEIALINRPEEAPLGAGEPALCPMVAAISNAIFDATGARLRRVPYTPDTVLAAIQAARS